MSKTDSEIKEIKDKILTSINNVKSSFGYKLVYGGWGDNASRCACPLGCVVIDNDINHLLPTDRLVSLDKASDYLNVSIIWVTEFIAGFDNQPLTTRDVDTDAYKLGLDLHNELNPIFIDDVIGDIVD